MSAARQHMLVTFLLDRTGSMHSCKEATIEAFNAYLKNLQDEDGKENTFTEFTFLQFDSSSIDKIAVAWPVKKVEFLNDSTYQPRASTPLIDAAWKTIKATETALTKRDDKPKVVVCIQTDGQENASTEHTMAELNQLVKEKTAEGWQFIFMGAGIDAYADASKYGFLAASTVSYDRNNAGRVKAAFVSASMNTRRFGSGQATNTNFSMKQRMASGDAFIPDSLTKDPLDLTGKVDATSGSHSAPQTPPRASVSQREPAKPIVDDLVL